MFSCTQRNQLHLLQQPAQWQTPIRKDERGRQLLNDYAMKLRLCSTHKSEELRKTVLKNQRNVW